MLTHATHLVRTKNTIINPFLTSRLIFATGGTGAGSGGSSGSGNDTDAEKTDAEKKLEEEKKQKEKDESEKQKEKEKKNKEGTAKGKVDVTQKGVSKKTEKILETSAKIERGFEGTQNEKLKAPAEKIKAIMGSTAGINKKDAKNQEEIKSQVDQLISDGRITKEKAQAIMDLDPTEKEFDEKWDKLISSVPELKKNAPVALEKIKELKVAEAK